MNSWQPKPKHILIGLCIAVALWLCAWIFPLIFIKDYQTRGQFGDMFGAANSLFSGLAMVGVVYAVFLQTKEIEAQRQEQQANEQFRRAQLDALNLNVQTLNNQLHLAKAASAPAIQWRAMLSTVLGGSRYDFINRGGRMIITKVRILNDPSAGIGKFSFSTAFIPTDEKGWVEFVDSKGPRPLNAVFELHYNATYGPEMRKYQIINGKKPIEVA